MKHVEPIAAVFVLVGIVLKLLNVNLASTLLITGLGTLGISYCILLPVFLNIPLKSFSILAMMFCGVGLSIALVGVLFRLNFWPGASTLLYIGCGAALMVLVYAYLNSRQLELLQTYDPGEKPAYNFYLPLLYRAAAVLLLALSVTVWPETRQYAFWNRNDPELVRLYMRMKENPQDQKAQLAWREYVRAKHLNPKR
ncbi:MAG: hypothetical protein MUF42_17115 [Cytophagaceae bacterium]|jgi:hypothetical protein|nr:hypothetical protein [Cytophagaceae bacterium]